jgi:hypothetical protein
MEVAPPSKPTAGEWLKRLLLQLVDRASEDVDRLRESPEHALHRLRLRMKKAEALLKLSKGAVGKTRRWRLRQQMRAVKNAGGGQRDAEVVAKLARELGRKKGLLLPLAAVPKSRPPREKLRVMLIRLRRDLSEEIFDDLTWDDVRQNYGSEYRAGSRCMAHSERTMEAGAFHKWRKRVKRTYYQTLALEKWLPHPRQRLQRTRKLAKLLGRDHDLTLLANASAGQAPENPWLAVVQERRDKLRPRIFALSCKLYRQPSHRFARLRKLPGVT